MPVLRKYTYRFIVYQLVFLLTFSCVIAFADFDLVKIDSSVEDDLLQVSTQAVLSLANEPQKALDNGVDLRIIFDVQLMRSRNWLWDWIIDDWEMLFTLHFHQLSGQYILAVPQSDRIQTYNNIERALFALASQLSFNLGHQARIKKNSNLYLRARLSLDKEYLPAPLKLFALLANDWELDTGWTIWILGQ